MDHLFFPVNFSFLSHPVHVYSVMHTYTFVLDRSAPASQPASPWPFVLQLSQTCFYGLGHKREKKGWKPCVGVRAAADDTQIPIFSSSCLKLSCPRQPGWQLLRPVAAIFLGLPARLPTPAITYGLARPSQIPSLFLPSCPDEGRS